MIGLGVTVRLSMAFVACLGGKLVFKERLFIALSWIPKATVQAALASVPADLIDEYMADKPDYLKYKAWGQAIITISVFSIILTAPVGLIIINLLGPRWLSREEDELEGVESPTNQSPSSMATLKLMEQEDGVQVLRLWMWIGVTSELYGGGTSPPSTRRAHLDAPGQQQGQQPHLRDGQPPE